MFFCSLQEDFKLHYNTCALVSNSGQLLNSRASDEINQAECIIRMNNAPTMNYTKDVGNRTTIRVCSFQAIANVNKELYAGKEKSDYVSINHAYSFCSTVTIMMLNMQGSMNQRHRSSMYKTWN